jgi:DNA-binding GntR family transcriptional regulator
MDRLPQRASLVAQTVEVLREAIAAGEWPQWLPGELELTDRLQVSRVTLRAALTRIIPAPRLSA